MLSRAKKNAREIASCRTACRVYVFVHLGAADIYVSNGKGTMWVDSYRFRYDHAPDDWSNGCINDGPGYYGRDMTCSEIIGRLLMNGRGTSGRDMTAGPVWGIRKVSQDNYERGDAAIGFFH